MPLRRQSRPAWPWAAVLSPWLHSPTSWAFLASSRSHSDSSSSLPPPELPEIQSLAAFHVDAAATRRHPAAETSWPWEDGHDRGEAARLDRSILVSTMSYCGIANCQWWKWKVQWCSSSSADYIPALYAFSSVIVSCNFFLRWWLQVYVYSWVNTKVIQIRNSVKINLLSPFLVSCSFNHSVHAHSSFKVSKQFLQIICTSFF